MNVKIDLNGHWTTQQIVKLQSLHIPVNKGNITKTSNIFNEIGNMHNSTNYRTNHNQHEPKEPT